MLSHNSFMPSISIAQMYCENTESRIVFPTLRNTQAWVPGWEISRQGIIRLIAEDFSEPRPPDRS